MKYFIITVDTEGDNLWYYQKGDTIATHNTKFIPRFQELCEKYGFKPVYLTNYEMLCDEEFVEYVKAKETAGMCEVGLHLHAWNNPPIYELSAKYSGNPYLIEYPVEIMEAKFKVLYELFCEKIGHKPTSHRAGRWAMNDNYFKLLEQYDIKVDCSVTPHVNWENCMGAQMGGTNYEGSESQSHWIGNILEVPFTVVRTHRPMEGSLRGNLKTILVGKVLHFRPAVSSLQEMKYIVDSVAKDQKVDHLELMLHSSELMPGGSPYFKDEDSINQMYCYVESLFQYVSSNKISGASLCEYYNAH